MWTNNTTVLEAGPKIEGAHRIAVLRANGIGDFMFTLPALESLRAGYPGAEITLIGLRWHRRFLAGRPSPVDRVLVAPAVKGVGAEEDGDPDVTAAWFALRQAESYDLAIQMHGGGRYSNPFVRRLGARVTVGLQAPDATQLDRNVPYVYFQAEVMRCLEAVAAAGAPPVTLEPRISVTADDMSAAAAFVVGDRTLAVLHPGAGDPRRRWPLEHFAEVGRRLANEGCLVVVTGEASDADLVSALAAAVPGAIDASGDLSLGGLAGLFSRASVVVANDTGPLHLAAAAGAPTVGIYWCGNAINAAPASRTKHRPVLSFRVECAVCGARTDGPDCGHRESYVDLAPVDEVIAHALDLVQRHGAGG